MKYLNVLFLLLLVLTSKAIAHGDEDHSHGDTPAAQVQGRGQPRVETATESFELVGYLQGGELSVFVDRFETNEPVLDGQLEVELDGAQAAGKFRAERGDYVISDEHLVKALAKPDKHALVFTLAAGDESDLLEGVLEVHADAAPEAKGGLPWTWTGAGMVAALVLITLAAKLRRSR